MFHPTRKLAAAVAATLAVVTLAAAPVAATTTHHGHHHASVLAAPPPTGHLCANENDEDCVSVGGLNSQAFIQGRPAAAKFHESTGKSTGIVSPKNCYPFSRCAFDAEFAGYRYGWLVVSGTSNTNCLSDESGVVRRELCERQTRQWYVFNNSACCYIDAYVNVLRTDTLNSARYLGVNCKSFNLIYDTPANGWCIGWKWRP